jgi:shikimate dehydrogenase
MNPYRFGLIGFPLAHSRSPEIQLAGLQALGLAGEYRLYPVPPAPQGLHLLNSLTDKLRAGELDGLNVTIPHKQSIMPFLDQLSPTAGAIGAVNTVYMQENQLIGENTDAPGFLADLHRLAPQIFNDQRAALVLGAGGSARAVAAALLGAKFSVVLAARRVEEAQKIAVASGQTAIRLDSTSLASIAHTPITLIVNTTPVGMSPQIDTSPWPETAPFPPMAVVYDLVYNPIETRFVHQARQFGLKAYTGLGMLVEQAALALEIWTGRPAPRQAMHAAVQNLPANTQAMQQV